MLQGASSTCSTARARRSGRVMAIAVHPFVTGQPHRIGALDAALEYICSHDGVWRATGREIVEHYQKFFPS